MPLCYFAGDVTVSVTTTFQLCYHSGEVTVSVTKLLPLCYFAGELTLSVTTTSSLCYFAGREKSCLDCRFTISSSTVVIYINAAIKVFNFAMFYTPDVHKSS